MYKPMLAATIEDLNALHFPLLASPKLDGVRCVVRGGHALTRSLKPVPNHYIRAYLSRPEFEGLDGEIMVEGTFQDITSATMSHDGEPDFTYAVFDLYHPADGYTDRYARMLEVTDARILHVESTVLHKVADVLKYEENALAEGFEGVMLRAPRGLYKCGRSTVREGGLLKLKRFFDAEAEVIGVEPLYHNTNAPHRDATGRQVRPSDQAGQVASGTLGALVCRRPDGVEFRVGSGFTQAQRVSFWQQKSQLIGQLCKYKYLPIGAKEAPRHPVFLGFRDKSDI